MKNLNRIEGLEGEESPMFTGGLERRAMGGGIVQSPKSKVQSRAPESEVGAKYEEMRLKIRFFLKTDLIKGERFRECCRCCRCVADMLPIKLLIDNDVADVADFPTSSPRSAHGTVREYARLTSVLHRSGSPFNLNSWFSLGTAKYA